MGPKQGYVDYQPEDLEALPGRGTLGARYAVVTGMPGSRPSSLRNEPLGASSLALLNLLFPDEKPYITNLVKKNIVIGRKIPVRVIRQQYPYLLQELKQVAPKRVLAVGQEAAETLCPGFTNMREDHGVFFWNPELDAYVIPTLKFSDLRDRTLLPQVRRDVERLRTLPDPVPPLVTTLETSEVKKVVSTLDGYCVLDIETTGLNFGDQITAIGFSDLTDENVYELIDPSVEDIHTLRQSIIDADLTVIGHHLQFDLARMGYNGDRLWMLPVEDTLLISHVTGERGEEDRRGSLSLKHLTTKYTDRPGSHAFGAHNSTGSALQMYLAEDVLSTREVYLHFRKQLIDRPRWILSILHRMVPVMVAMQIRGLFIDREGLEGLEHQYAKAKQKALKKLSKLGEGINWNSDVQVGTALIAAGVRLHVTTDTGQFSVAEAALLPHKDHPAVSQLLAYRELDKNHQFLTSYLAETSDEDPYLRPKLKLDGTDTGRLSSRNPNIQQVPRVGPIKTLFRSRYEGGKIGLIDLAQAELRVVAMLSGDPLLVQALLSSDVHRTIASMVYGLPPEQITSAQRKKSKGVTFGLLYGGSEEGLADRIGVSVHEVSEVMQKIFGVFKHLNQWILQQHELARRTGITETLLGRTRDLTKVTQRSGQKAANRRATNTPVQSIASDMDLIIMFVCSELLVNEQLKSRPIAGIHDSILFDIYPGEERAVAEVIQFAFTCLNDTPLSTLDLWGKLPMAGELLIGKSWAHIESTNENFSPELLYPMESTPGVQLVSNKEAKKLALTAIEEKLAGG